MSTPGPDPSVVELALEFEGLQITVRGPPERTAGFLQQVAGLSRGSHQVEGAPRSGPTSSHYGSPLRSEPPAASSTAAETRDSILASFPPCPQRLLQLAARKLGGSAPAAEGRARRAWTAGNWARATASGRVSSPNKTPVIDLQNRYWVVVRASSCRAPRIFTTSGAYHRALGPLEGSDSISHAFPSETEARIYLEAAGLEVDEFN